MQPTHVHYLYDCESLAFFGTMTRGDLATSSQGSFCFIVFHYFIEVDDSIKVFTSGCEMRVESSNPLAQSAVPHFDLPRRVEMLSARAHVGSPYNIIFLKHTTCGYIISAGFLRGDDG
jgi:hypothetical protein